MTEKKQKKDMIFIASRAQTHTRLLSWDVGCLILPKTSSTLLLSHAISCCTQSFIVRIHMYMYANGRNNQINEIYVYS